MISDGAQTVLAELLRAREERRDMRARHHVDTCTVQEVCVELRVGSYNPFAHIRLVTQTDHPPPADTQLDTTPWPPVKPPPSHLASRRPTTRARADRALNTPCRPLQHPASARPKTASRFRHPKRPRRARPPRPRRPRAAPRASFDPRLRASLCLQMARASASSTGTWPD